MSTLSIDFESRSTVDLSKTGAYVYAADPTTDIWCMAWAFDDEEPAVWTPNDYEWHGVPISGLHPRILEHIAAGGEIRAWNAAFERIMWDAIMVPRYGAPPVALEQWVCSMAEAAAMAIPLKLEKAAIVLKTEMQKDMKGSELMKRMARPRKVNDDGSLVWWNVPERIAKLYEYCKQDVRTERAIVPRLRRLTPREREVYLLDQRINDRGVPVDLALVRAAKEVADEGVSRANADLYHLTDGKVGSVIDHRKLTSWVQEQGVVAEGVGKAAVAALLEGELPDSVRGALELRADAGKTSLAKLDSFLAASGPDSRVRGLLFYHAASTGRWGGRLVQPQNFPRGTVDRVEDFIPLVLAGDFDLIDVLEPPVAVVSSLLRAMIQAPPGFDLVAGDFSAIEARVLNWLAGQDDVVESFRRYDAGDKDRDPYKVMAVRMGRAPTVAEVTKADRQAGKAAELGCGYQMGAAKFVTAAWDVYQVRVDAREAKHAVDSYRATHPCVVDLWRDANEAALSAVRQPGAVFRFGAAKNLAFTCRGSYLYLILPSKRPLVYAAPKIVDREMSWGPVPTVEISAQDSYTRQWGRLHLYGGLIVENIVQAVARDLMVEAMFRCETSGYPVILTVHDEIVTEVPRDFGSVAEFERILCQLPPWASGCPIAAEGWRGERYRK